MIQVLWECIAACIGTVAFSALFSVPRQYYPLCGLIGGLGWFGYRVAQPYIGETFSVFAATVLVVLLSRFFAVRRYCPVTLFLISGIFPLVPGAGIYWTAYYLVVGELENAFTYGMGAVKAAIAIVLGILAVFELPQKIFRRWKLKKLFKKAGS